MTSPGFVEQEAIYNIAQAIADYGETVLIRRQTVLTGPTPSPNPFVLNGLVVNGNQAIGSAALNLRATSANGRFIPGDVIVIAGDTTNYVVQTATANTSNLFNAIPISPNLVVQATDGATVTPTFSADVEVPAIVTCVPARLVNDTSIQNGDLVVRFLSSAISWVPKTTDKIFRGYYQYSIVKVQGMSIQGVEYAYSVQCRGGVA